MRISPTIGAIALGLLAAAPAASAQQKLAYVDSRRIVQEAPGAQEATRAMEQQVRGFQQRLTALQDSLQKVLQDYQARSQMLTQEARASEEKRIGARQRELQAQADQLELEANRKREELMKPVMDKIQGAIDATRKEGGYAFILDAATGAFVSADSSLDLTTQVIARLKAASPAPAPKK
jgi:outer membrane protein